MEDAVSETNPTPHLPCPGTMPVLCRHGGTDGSDRLIDGCQTQPGRQVQRFKESALRFAPAQLSRDHLDQRFTGFGHAATQDNQSRVNGLGQNLDSVADGAHYHVQHIDGLGLPLFARRIRSGIGGSALGHRRPTDAPEQTVSKHPYCPQGHLRR